MKHKCDAIHIRVDPELREQLERLAAADERPMSAWVRRVLKAEAARHAPSQSEAA
jgi:predicted transcriptional regulator